MYRLFEHYFQRNRAALIASVISVAIFSSLGIWQLNRAEEKRLMLAEKAEPSGDVIHDLGRVQADSDAFRYRLISVSGRYDAGHQFLLDNRIVNGKPGYFVFTPFQPHGDGPSVLVNRGWVPLGASRSDLPDVDLEQAETRVEGILDRFPSVGLKLKNAEIVPPGWPAVVQMLDLGYIASVLNQELVPFQVLLDAAASEGYLRDWRWRGQPPERHTGYAFQWFAMAITVTALYLWYGVKRSR